MNAFTPNQRGPLRRAASAWRRSGRSESPGVANTQRTKRTRRPVAFVLSSGANLGAVQVGMLRALVEHGVKPDLIVGCSVGALNGAGFAEEPTLSRLDLIEEVWRTTDSKDLMPRQWMSPARALTHRGEAIHPIDGLRHLVERTLRAPTFESLTTPFQCVATDVLGAREHWFDRGPLVDAVLASSAMPAIFPTVEINGGRYFDGAAVIDVPVRRAAELGAKTLFVMEVGPLTRPWSEPKRPADTVMEAYWIARRHRFRLDLELLPPKVDVHLLPHGDPPSLKLHDFSQSGELIRSAYVATTAYLDGLYGPAPRRPENGTARSAPPAAATTATSGTTPSEAADVPSGPDAREPAPSDAPTADDSA